MDGFNSKFYKASWDVVGDDVVTVINQFFRTGKMACSWHITTITLIPKVKFPSNPGEFRSISCCHVIYNCISKLICSKLKLVLGSIIDQAQGVFVVDRSILHSILAYQDLVKQVFQISLSPRMLA